MSTTSTKTGIPPEIRAKRNVTDMAVCKTCKAKFAPARKDAKFCSAACRVKAYRKRRDAQIVRLRKRTAARKEREAKVRATTAEAEARARANHRVFNEGTPEEIEAMIRRRRIAELEERLAGMLRLAEKARETIPLAEEEAARIRSQLDEARRGG